MNIRAQIFGRTSEEPILRAKQPKGAKADDLHTVTVPREEPRRTNNRGEDRHRLVSEKVTVTYDGQHYEADLVNLSGGGAMISAAFTPKLWDRIDLHLGEHGQVECAVRWIRDGRMGLEFAHETRLDCSADEMAMVLRDVIDRNFADAQVESSRDEDVQPSNSDSEPGEHRGDRRHPLIWSGVLHYDYESTKVRVRNISATGAMIECNIPVRVGAEPVLDFGSEASLSATVQWVVGDQVGLRFHTPFDVRLLARSRPELAPTTWLRPAYLDTAPADEDSPWDPRWNRLTMSEINEELEGFLKR